MHVFTPSIDDIAVSADCPHQMPFDQWDAACAGLGMAEVWGHLGPVVLAVGEALLGAISIDLTAFVKASVAEAILAVG